MRSFPVPMDLTEEERTLGGILSLRQAVYLLVGIVITILVLLARPVPLPARLAVSVLPLAAGTGLAFFQPYSMRTDLFLLYGVRYLIRPKRLILRGDD